MPKILVADDHEVTRRGIRDILLEEFENLSIEETQDATETLEKAIHEDWDLILLDILMPGMNVTQLLKEIREVHPDTPILILTAVTEMEYVIRTIKAGANGYISKQHASDDLVAAIRKVLSGETYLSSDAISELVANLRGEDPEMPHQKLSHREMQVFRSIAMGKTIKEIGSELSLSEKTVGTYLSRIKEKTGLISYVEITRYAMQHRLVE